jgi:hypothetical protein
MNIDFLLRGLVRGGVLFDGADQVGDPRGAALNLSTRRFNVKDAVSA